MQLYKSVLQTGWAFTLKRPQLWIFGVFTYFVFGFGGEIERYLRAVASTVSSTSITNPEAWTGQQLAVFGLQFKEQLANGNESVWLFLIMILSAGVIILFMMAVAQAAIVHGVAHPRVTKFAALFNHGVKHAPVVMLLTICSTLGISVTTLAVAALSEALLGSSLILPAAVLAPIILGVGATHRFAMNYIVLEDAHLGSAIHKSMKLISEHTLVVAEMMVIIFAVALFVNVSIVLAMILIMSPYFASAVLVGGDNFQLLRSDAAVIGALFYMVSMVLFSAILTTWQWATWAELFMVLREERPTGKLLRWFGNDTK